LNKLPVEVLNTNEENEFNVRDTSEDNRDEDAFGEGEDDPEHYARPS
jgi:hypothetical protein